MVAIQRTFKGLSQILRILLCLNFFHEYLDAFFYPTSLFSFIQQEALHCNILQAVRLEYGEDSHFWYCLPYQNVIRAEANELNRLSTLLNRRNMLAVQGNMLPQHEQKELNVFKMIIRHELGHIYQAQERKEWQLFLSKGFIGKLRLFWIRHTPSFWCRVALGSPEKDEEITATEQLHLPPLITKRLEKKADSFALRHTHVPNEVDAMADFFKNMALQEPSENNSVIDFFCGTHPSDRSREKKFRARAKRLRKMHV